MEPLSDKELNDLLPLWRVPPAPPNLKPRMTPKPRLGWRWLVHGSIRVPVPVGIAAILLLAIWFYSIRVPKPAEPAVAAQTVTLTDLHLLNN